MLERVRELDAFPALPRVSFTHVRDFYARVRAGADLDALPVWVGELYLELHRGTLTTQGRVKFLHRRAERDLVAAEALGAMSALAGGAEPAGLEPQWRVLLRNEFHDILPGSSIRQVERAHRGGAGGRRARGGRRCRPRTWTRWPSAWSSPASARACSS